MRVGAFKVRKAQIRSRPATPTYKKAPMNSIAVKNNRAGLDERHRSRRPLPARVVRLRRKSDSAALNELCDLTHSQSRQRENLIHLPDEPDRGLVELSDVHSNQRIFLTCHTRWQGPSSTVPCALELRRPFQAPLHNVEVTGPKREPSPLSKFSTLQMRSALTGTCHTSHSRTACVKPSSGSRVGINSWPTYPL